MYMQFLIFCSMKIDYQMLKICEIFFNDQKKKAKYSVAILHCLTDTLKKKQIKTCICTLLIWNWIGGGGASPPGFTWPAWSSSWMFVISTTNSYKFRVHSRVHRGRTSRVRGLYKSWNSCIHSLFIPFYHLEYIHAFFLYFS